MKRVNRHPNPAPKASRKPPAAPQYDDDDEMSDEEPISRRPQAKPDIWAKVYAYETSEHEAKEAAKVQKLHKERKEQAQYLQRQLDAQEAERRAGKQEEVNYARYQEQELEKWKGEERQKAAIMEAKNAQEKVIFMQNLKDNATRRARQKEKKLRAEKGEVRRAAQALESDKQKKEKQKAELKVKMAAIQKENIDSLAIKAVQREKQFEYEKEMTKAYQAKLDKQQADREEALKAMGSHQALLYAKGKSTQEQADEFNRIQEERMIAAQKARNKMEDETARAKKARQQKADIDQVVALREQQRLQSQLVRDEKDLDIRLAMAARQEDQKAAMAAMQKELNRRKANMQHRYMIEKQKSNDKVRIEKAKEGMNELEMKLNSGMLRKIDSSLTMSGRAIVSSR